MNIIYDSGSLINLANGHVLHAIFNSSHHNAFIGPLVYDECVSIAPELKELLDSGELSLLADASLTPTEFSDLLQRHGLGVGETECIAFLSRTDFVVSCDDAAARKVLMSLYGADRVTGTLGLLILAVGKHEISLEAAFASYQQMRAAGGYLPALSLEGFTALLS